MPEYLVTYAGGPFGVVVVGRFQSIGDAELFVNARRGNGDTTRYHVYRNIGEPSRDAQTRDLFSVACHSCGTQQRHSDGSAVHRPQCQYFKF